MLQGFEKFGQFFDNLDIPTFGVTINNMNVTYLQRMLMPGLDTAVEVGLNGL